MTDHPETKQLRALAAKVAELAPRYLELPDSDLPDCWDECTSKYNDDPCAGCALAIVVQDLADAAQDLAREAVEFLDGEYVELDGKLADAEARATAAEDRLDGAVSVASAVDDGDFDTARHEAGWFLKAVR